MRAAANRRGKRSAGKAPKKAIPFGMACATQTGLCPFAMTAALFLLRARV